jgi:uracil-DNA glycosylase
MRMEELIERLRRARIGATFNFYRDGDGAVLRRERLLAYLADRADAPLLLVGEAPGFRGARVSGIPFTSERQLTGSGPAEATATIVHRVLAELGIEDEVVFWNVVPTHPGTASSNRRPSRAEVEDSLPYLRELARGRQAIAVGRLAHGVLGDPYVRHPSHGGAVAFAAAMQRLSRTRRSLTTHRRDQRHEEERGDSD